ncbi:hypothetical protein [Natronomonas marina]|uniref:hypothetical protein n=1 Tax=Natronomonas marina TaxID=2961939 RepID=UPI0020C9EF69|nr:hypothetical protein [Natronomonas marina]
MATSQATFGDIEPDTADRSESNAVPRWLENPATIEAGAKILVDRNDHREDRAYTVTETRSKSLIAERDGNEIELRKRRGEWVHGRTSFTSTVKLLSTPEKPLLRCAECGEARDPADFARRDGRTYTCGECVDR